MRIEHFFIRSERENIDESLYSGKYSFVYDCASSSASSFSSLGWGRYFTIFIKFPDCLFGKNIVWYTWNLKWGLQSKSWPLFIFFLAEKTWKFLHKNPSFLPPLPKPYELYWPLLRLLLYVSGKLLSSNMKVSLKARLPGTFILCGRLTLKIPSFSFVRSFLAWYFSMAGVEELYKQFGILADANEKAGEVRTCWNVCQHGAGCTFHVDVKIKRPLPLPLLIKLVNLVRYHTNCLKKKERNAYTLTRLVWIVGHIKVVTFSLNTAGDGDNMHTTPAGSWLHSLEVLCKKKNLKAFLGLKGI